MESNAATVVGSELPGPTHSPAHPAQRGSITASPGNGRPRLLAVASSIVSEEPRSPANPNGEGRVPTTQSAASTMRRPLSAGRDGQAPRVPVRLYQRSVLNLGESWACTRKDVPSQRRRLYDHSIARPRLSWRLWASITVSDALSLLGVLPWLAGGLLKSGSSAPPLRRGWRSQAAPARQGGFPAAP
jgi:hypothetical protein